VEVREENRVRLESHGDAAREMEANLRRQHPEQVRVARAVLRPETRAAGDVRDSIPEVGRVPILADILPDDEVMSPLGRLDLEAGYVDRLPVRCDRVLACLPVATRGNDERRHPHLEAMRGPAEP
jgi:hypothetical protein